MLNCIYSLYQECEANLSQLWIENFKKEWKKSKQQNKKKQKKSPAKQINKET